MKTNITPEIRTAEGPIRGVVEEGVFAYKGIPYAKPPVGKLRWREPKPVEHWHTVLQLTTKYKSASWQDEDLCTLVGGGDPGTMDEDCLYLNVWTPPHEEGAALPKLPVMVWIHGGAFVIGAGGLPPYHGAPTAKRGAILVTVNYRLGVLGFFRHNALDAERTDTGLRVNNFALLDQIAALEWVQRNIAKFGGDSENVTIFGQSAGARSVLALFSTPLLNKPKRARLFHRGIAQSVYRFPDISQDRALKRGHKLATAAGLPGKDATAEQLRGKAPHELMNIRALPPNTPNPFKGTTCDPCAIFGDDVLPKGTFDTFKNGEEAALPLILGNTSDDGSVLKDSGFGPEWIYDNIPLIPLFLKPGEQYYPDLKDEKPPNKEEAGRRVSRDAFFTVITNRIAESHRTRAPTWRYYYEYTAENLVSRFPSGPRHGDDIIFTMNTGDFAPLLEASFTARDRTFAGKVSEYWFEFARTGVPVCASGPQWPVQTNNSDDPIKDTKTLRLGETITVETDLMKSHMAKFESIGVGFDTVMVLDPDI